MTTSPMAMTLQAGNGLGRGYSLNTAALVAPTLGSSYGVDNLAHAVTASAGHHGHSSPRGDGSDNLIPELAYALAARDAKGTNTREGTNTLIPIGGVRRLTPLECERLMGWPDDHTRYTSDGTEIADSHRYRMCGNGVVAPVAEWIGHRLVAVDRHMHA